MAFQPGQSGNPSGRPKEDPTLRLAARAHTEAALQVLVDAMSDDSARNRITAAQAILDRGHGKPAQAVDIGNTDGEPFKLEQIVRRIVNADN
jgi:hypothetical protein